MFGLQQSVRTLFELIRLHRIIDIFNTRDEAVSAYRM
jgi:anti-anti-sigma regulatory factor